MRPQPDFIHEFIPGSSSRTLLLLHGTGGNERDLIPLGRALDPNASLLGPRGKVLENGMPRFFRRLAEGVFDLEDFRDQLKQIHSMGGVMSIMNKLPGINGRRYTDDRGSIHHPH